MKIQKIIVVEGKDDTRRLRKVVNADTIKMISSAINEDILIQVEHAQGTRGVIVFADPDLSGEKIRKIIMETVPQAKHAFLSRIQAEPKKRESFGVEHASDVTILEALRKVVTPDISQTAVSEITRQDLLDCSLTAEVQAKEKREELGDELRIGCTSGKQLEERLKMFRITPKELAQAIKIVEE